MRTRRARAGPPEKASTAGSPDQRRPGRLTKKVSAANISTRPSVAQVYDGLRMIGAIYRLADGWRAFDADGLSLGRGFPTERQACRAIYAASRECRP